MKNKFRELGFIGLILKIAGIGELVVGFACLIILPLVFSDTKSGLQQFGFLYLFPGTELLIGVFVGLVVFFVALVCGLLTYSMGEVFNLLIAIEENSRVIRDSLHTPK